MLSLAYIGSRTVHADSGTVLNVPLPGPGAIAARRPIPQLSQISDIRWNGWATYHALTLAAKRRFAKGLMFDANWTWSHSIDDASDPGATLNETNLPQDVYNLAAEKASSSFDHRHRVVVSFIYQIPLPRMSNGWMRALFGQWQAGGNFTAQSGAPFTVNISSDQANIGAGPRSGPTSRESERRAQDTSAMVRYVRLFFAGALHLRERASKRRDRTWHCRSSISRFRKKCRLSEALSYSFAPKPTTFSITPTSTSRTERRSLRTSAAFPARRTLGNFNLH